MALSGMKLSKNIDVIGVQVLGRVQLLVLLPYKPSLRRGCDISKFVLSSKMRSVYLKHPVEEIDNRWFLE